MTPDCPFNMVSLRQQVYDYLRSQMNQGELRPGSAINLGEMSSRFGISRTPLREALLQLETEGFVTIYPRKGIIVNPLSEEDIRHAYEIIGALEASVVFNERNSITSTETEKMRRLNLLMREALDRVVKYLIEYERITGEEFEKIFRNEPVELVSYKERKEALEKPDEEEKPEDESDDRTGDEPEQRHEGSGEDSPEDKPEKEAEQKFYRPGGFDGEDK